MSNINSYVVKVGDVVEIITNIWGEKSFGRKYKVIDCHPSGKMFYIQNGFTLYEIGNNIVYKVVREKKRKIG